MVLVWDLVLNPGSDLSYMQIQNLFRRGMFRATLARKRNLAQLFSVSRWNVMLILRLVLALIFALVAFIFTEIIPDIQPFNHNILRLVIAFWFGLMGYGLFPDLARIISINTIFLFNSLATRVGL